ncbi:MAG: hypothetical protein ACM3SY_17280 [Candidatus Omnitrophota bacterium]
MNVDTEIIQQKVDELRQKYSFKVTQKAVIPTEIVAQYGSPLGYESVEDGFLMWLRPGIYESMNSNFICLSRDFKPERELIQTSHAVVDVSVDPVNKYIFSLEVNLYELFKGNAEGAFADKGNRIALYDRDGRFIDHVVCGSNTPFFATSFTRFDPHTLAYFDLISREIRIVDFSGNILRQIPTGNRLIRRLRGNADTGLYFISLFNKNWLGIETEEKFETVYRCDANNQIEKVFENQFGIGVYNQIYDLEVDDDRWMYAADQFFGKCNGAGDEVFRVSMKHSAWQINGEYLSPYIISLKKDATHPHCLYAMARNYHTPACVLYQLTV